MQCSWHGRYPGYEDGDVDISKELQQEWNDSVLLEDVLALLPPREAEDYVEFAPVGSAPSVSNISKRRSKQLQYNGTYRLSNTDAPLVKETLESNGYVPSVHHRDWLVHWSGPSLKEREYTGLHEFQRVNHFPGSTELTRKDRLWSHYRSMQKMFAKTYFDFIPDTYCIPDQLEEFYAAYERQDCFWIVKPSASSCGRGVFILRDLNELPHDSAIISVYVARPMLIQGLKYDLRLYVLVTGFDPLRAYIYREGLARFASSTFSLETEADVKDVYKHLTNYSVNKFATNFVENQDARLDNFGHKWSLSALNKHLETIGVDVAPLWGRIIDVVTKTLLVAERPINQHGRKFLMWRQNCFELYGFDILIDEALKPWLLEVNLSPSMQTESPLDRQIKSNLLAEAMNLIRLRSYDQRTIGRVARCRSRGLQSRKILVKKRAQPSARQRSSTEEKKLRPRRHTSLRSLSEKHLKLLADVLSEFAIARNFIRIFPTEASVKRYGHMLSCSPITGALTATQAMINLLFNEKHSIRTESEGRRPPPIYTAFGERPATGVVEDAVVVENEEADESPTILYGEEEDPRIPRVLSRSSTTASSTRRHELSDTIQSDENADPHAMCPETPSTRIRPNTADVLDRHSQRRHSHLFESFLMSRPRLSKTSLSARHSSSYHVLPPPSGLRDYLRRASLIADSRLGNRRYTSYTESQTDRIPERRSELPCMQRTIPAHFPPSIEIEL